MTGPHELNIHKIIDSLSDGVYVCTLDRTITYWSKSAERITGWTSEEVIGRRCKEGILNHVDKDGHRLCGEEYCPLHRSMLTGMRSETPLLVYAKGKNGQRIPMEVSVAPVRNDEGEIVGGVETFREAHGFINDLEMAQTIQKLALRADLPDDDRISVTTCYRPKDIVGGDYYALKQLAEDHYGFILADVMGHGISAALYTMHLSSLWDRYSDLLLNPAEFAGVLNKKLQEILRGNEYFATAACGCINLRDRTLEFVGAGSEALLLWHKDGTYQRLESAGIPFGLIKDTAYKGAVYKKVAVNLEAGDSLLVFSDGAVEILNAGGEILGVAGLVNLLRKMDYPATGLQVEALEEELLKSSNALRLEDDLTVIEIRF